MYICNNRSAWAFLVLGLLLATAACSGRKADPPATKVEENNDPNVFAMKDPGQFTTAPVELRDVRDEIRVNGVIAPDVNRAVPVVSLGSGRVVEIKAKLGDQVRKGQTLLLINSPDLTQAFSDYQKARSIEELARKQLARAQLLYDKGAIAQADLETSQDNDARAKVDVQAAAEHVRVLGGDISHPEPLLPLRAPISGVIVEQNTTGGTGVKSLDNSPNLFTIADLSEVWVLCDVYEDMLSRVHVGDTAYISLNAYPGQEFTGKIVNISDVLDPATRTAKVRIELPNPKGEFKAGMFVTATFRSKQPVQRVVVPASAVVHLHDKDWVFVPAGTDKFRRVVVQLGPEAGQGQQQVLAGLQAGDKVVTNALQLSSASEEQ